MYQTQKKIVASKPVWEQVTSVQLTTIGEGIQQKGEKEK